MTDSNPTNRVNVTLPADWEAAMKAQAEAEGVSLSAWLRDCAAANLEASVRQKLSRPKSAGRPTAQYQKK